MQFPDFTPEDCAKLKEKNKNLTFYQFVTLEEEERNKFLTEAFPGKTDLKN